jgi:amino acid permease
MSSILKAPSSENDKRIYRDYKYSITSSELLVCYLNAAVGSGILKLGTVFSCGLITSLVLCIITGFVNYYSLFLFLKAGQKTCSGSFEDIWVVLWGKKTGWICVFIAVLRKIINIKGYFSFIYETIALLINTVSTDHSEWWFTDRFSLSIIIILLFVIPLALFRTLNVVIILSYVKHFFLAVLFGMVIFFFSNVVRQYGFDPNHELVMWSLDKRAISCLTTVITSYFIYPIAYPGLNHMRSATVNKLNKMFILFIIICFFLNYIFGLFCYISLFGRNKGGTIINYFPDGVFKIVAQICLMMMIVTTIPVAISPVKYIILNFFSKIETIGFAIWFQIGVSIGVICALMANFTGDINKYFSIISDLLRPVIMCIFPAVFFLKCYGLSSKIHFILSIGMIILGIGFDALVIYDEFIAK